MELKSLLALTLVTIAVAGCGSREPMASDAKTTDPYAGMTKAQKIEAIRNDPKITDMSKQSQIADLEKG